jgi:prephenate dehydrogenase
MDKIVHTNIAVIGLGLIGGSLALDLKSAMSQLRILGIDQNPAHCAKAIQLGIVDQIIDLDALSHEAMVILLCIPVDAIVHLLPQLLDRVHANSIVIDTGSTKGAIVASIADHPKRGRFVAAHPIAGTEHSGPEAAVKGLFMGKLNILCDINQTDADALSVARVLFERVGMHEIAMDAKSHDKHLAYVSHLSHISSFMLGLTVLDIEKDEKQIFQLAGSGFASTVRLAKSSAAMWAPIFAQNKTHLQSALNSYIAYLQEFSRLIEEENQSAMKELMQEANRIKEII